MSGVTAALMEREAALAETREFDLFGEPFVFEDVLPGRAPNSMREPGGDPLSAAAVRRAVARAESEALKVVLAR